MAIANELLSFVMEELYYFQFEWKESISDAHIRRASASLRSLLHEGQLQRAWKDAGFEKQPKILSSNLSQSSIAEVSQQLHPGVLRAFHAGGTPSNGLILANATVWDMSTIPTNEQLDKLFRVTFPEAKAKCIPMTLGDFSKSVCLVLEGKTFTRTELVLYAANKMGGTHLDASRDISKRLDQKYALLDKHRAATRLTDRDPVLYEIMNTINYLRTSKDMHRLRKTIEKKLGAAPGTIEASR